MATPRQTERRAKCHRMATIARFASIALESKQGSRLPSRYLVTVGSRNDVACAVWLRPNHVVARRVVLVITKEQHRGRKQHAREKDSTRRDESRQEPFHSFIHACPPKHIERQRSSQQLASRHRIDQRDVSGSRIASRKLNRVWNPERRIDVAERRRFRQCRAENVLIQSTSHERLLCAIAHRAAAFETLSIST